MAARNHSYNSVAREWDPEATSGTLLGSGVLYAKRRVFPVSGRTERSLGSTIGELQADTDG